MATLSCTPAFTHDCADCAFVCHVKPAQGEAFDLYRTCEGNGGIVARVGNEGPDYYSIPQALFSLHGTDSHGDTTERAIWIISREAWVKGLMAL